MKTVNSLRDRIVAVALCVVMVLGMFPANVIAHETAAAKIGDTVYDTLAEAMAAVPTGSNQTAPAEATTITLLQNTSYAFDVGDSTGSTTMNLKLDLNGNTLTLAPSVGSAGTKANGIRVLAFSKLEILNGTIVCSSEASDNVKVGIANYGELILDSVALKAGELTIYTVNNRGALTLKGNTSITSGSVCAITNDPYNLYYTEDVDASVTCDSSDVFVESILVERYQRNSANKGGVKLNISAGYIGKIVEDGDTAVSANYNITGGTIGVATAEELEFALNIVNAGAEYACPQQPVTIKLLNSMSGSFDVGNSTGTAPKNILLDLNGNTLTLKPGIGSVNTQSNGIRVLAYSKLEIKNGTLICSDEAADNVKVGIANYGELILDSVDMKDGAQTIYTVNNRGALTLKGNTSITSGSVCAITNDPYNLYYTEDVDASVTCDSNDVFVESILVERYERNSANKGGVKLNISAGYIGKIEEDGNASVAADYNITGGTFGTDVSDFCSDNQQVIQDDNGNYVVKSKQTEFGFEKEEYKVTFGADGNKFTATAKNAAGNVTYSFVSETDVATINAESGELTILKAGTVQVKAVATGNEQYVEGEATYTLVIEPAYAEVYSFSGGTVTGSATADTVVSIDQVVLEWVEKDESIGRMQDGWWVGIKVVAPEGVDLNKVVYQRRSGGSFDGAEVTPFVPDDDRYMGMWGFITDEYLESFSEAGKNMNYVWRFSWDGDDFYEQTITITIDPNGVTLKQSGFAFGIHEDTVTYGANDNIYPIVIPTGGQSAEKPTYTVDDETVATVNNDGTLTIHKSGDVTITATLKGKYFEDITASYVLHVEKAEQSDFGFANAPASITWQKDALNALELKNAMGEGKVVWNITAGKDVASVDPATGKITLSKAGTFTITAQKLGDDCYLDSAVAAITIDVNTAENKFSFQDGDKVSVTYGTLTYKNPVVNNLSEGELTYSISDNNIGADIDADGNVTFEASEGKVGKVTVTVTRAEDERYQACTASYELEVEYLAAPQEKATLSGEKKNDSDWYTGVVTITAPAGYQISRYNALDNTDWSSSITYDKEGIGSETVFFKDQNGYITGAVLVENIHVDTNAPQELTISYATPAWEVMLENMSFGLYTASNLEVTVSAKDASSGVASLIYNIGQGDVTVPCDGTATFQIKAEYRNNITLKAVDVAGNESQLKEDSIVVVLDQKNPELSVSYAYATGKHNAENGIIYTQGKTTIDFTLDEANFDLSGLEKIKINGQQPAVSELTGVPVLLINGKKAELDWNPVENTTLWTASTDLEGDGDYVVTLTFTDPANNEMDPYTQEIHIDSEVPVLSVSYDNNESRNENYYKENRTATITVTEHNFKPANVQLTIDAVDINGDTVDISGKGYEDYAKNAEKWTEIAEDVWVLNTDGMKLDIDAIYTIQLQCTDLAGNEAETYAAEFVIDKLPADNVRISYSESIVDKILNAVTFGFYQGDVTIKVTAEDMVAGVEYFRLTFVPEDGANTTNKETFTTEKLNAVPDADNPNVFCATYVLEADARGKILVDVVDKAGNESTTTEDGTVLVADTANPVLTPSYVFTNEQSREYNGIFYTQGDTTVYFTIDEANFDLSMIQAEDENAAPVPQVTVNGVVQNVPWTQTQDTNLWIGYVDLSGDGDYVVTLTYTDRSGKLIEEVYSQEIHIDSAAPVLSVSYDNNESRNENNYKGNRTATITINEHNFNPAEVKLSVTAKDINGQTVDISDKGYEAYVQKPENWTCEDDIWTLDTEGMKLDIDARYTVQLQYTDLAENEADAYTAEFVIDKTIPANIDIEYEEYTPKGLAALVNYLFFREQVLVTVTAEDITAGVEYIALTYAKEADSSDINTADFAQVLELKQDGDDKSHFSATCVIPANARGTVSVVVMDKAGNHDVANEEPVIVVDNKSPIREVIYTPYKVLDAKTMLEVDAYEEGDDCILYYNDDAVVTFKITEANFDLSLLEESEQPKIMVNDVPVSVEWTQEGDVWTATYTISGDGDYEVTMTYKDLSDNEMVDYKSCKIAIDTKAPVIDVDYQNEKIHQTIDGTDYYGENMNIQFTITEHNFRADDVVLTVTAKDIQGNDVAVNVQAYADYAKNRENWVTNGDVHTLNLEGMLFDKDARYTFTMNYDDICDQKAEERTGSFVVDHKAPENLTINYKSTVLNTIIDALTFDFFKFYNPELVVELVADDITAGVDFFEWEYRKESGTSDKNAETYGAKITADKITYSNDGKTATATFTIPAEARGNIYAKVTDQSGNAATTEDKNIINVVDKIAPEISVSYAATNSATNVQFVDANNTTVDSFDKAATAYYDGNVTVTIVVDEANFFEGVASADGVVHKLGIKLTKTDDNDKVSVIEYLPKDAAQLYTDATASYITWSKSGDQYTTTITYADNADYVLEIDYTDLSENDSKLEANDGLTGTKTYKSKTVTVDKVAPVISVAYSDTDFVQTIDGRDYFEGERTAVITVTEHNFRAADMKAVVTALDVLGNAVKVEDFAATLADEAAWTRQEGTNDYTAELVYSVDANYTFDIDFVDLAGNASADYTTDLFTVDTKNPYNLEVTYSTSVFQEILNSVTFGYYNAMMTVTISAEDDTSGIYHFAYSYIKDKYVSGVNAELLDQAIKEAAITYNGKKATATFRIPKLALGYDNQFNGTVKFTAYDRAERNTDKEDNTRIVVDNIAPTATITYNAPVQEFNNISYYDGDINATIVINEANFRANDVVVTVTKNGEDYPVNVTWNDNSLDSHTGTFTLTEDGDYFVSVRYADKSGNQMQTYTSNELTLDTTAPTIKVSNIKNNTANKDVKYGFVIEISDIKLDVDSMNPVLKAVVKDADGNYKNTTIQLGAPVAVTENQTYTYTVENLATDALYTLTCEAQDMSENKMAQIVLDDGKSYQQVQFSINRNGSTFGYGTEYTEELVDQYYVYSVDEDVVVVEVNVDPVENYTVTLNGKELTEGTDYTTEQTSNVGEWSKRTYTIKKDLFAEEGEYNIIVSSTDKAETTAFSDVKNLSLRFVVDQTKPVITITGLAAGGRYQTEAQTVTLIPSDEGGRLYSLTVLALNSDGNPLADASGNNISNLFSMEGEELLQFLADNDGKITVIVPEGLNNQVAIICNDCAVNAEGKTNEYNELFKNVTVSPNQLVIFYANKPAFFGTIGGVSAAGVALFFLLKSKKLKAKAKV